MMRVALLLIALTGIPAGAAYGQTARVIAGDGPGYPQLGSFAGDGGHPLKARFKSPAGISAERDGGLLIIDSLNQRVRRVKADKTHTVAGSGRKGDCGDQVDALRLCMRAPHGVLSDGKGGFWIADTFNAKIRHVNRKARARTVLGGVCHKPNWACSQQGREENVKLGLPISIKPYPGGGLIITDAGTHKILLWKNQQVKIIAGYQGAGFSGDGGPAVEAQLHEPQDAVAYKAGVLIADGGNCRLRYVNQQGVIESIAGQGQSKSQCQAKIADWNPGGELADGPALQSEIQVPAGLSVRGEAILVSDFLGGRVREIKDGWIQTIMGYLGPARVEPNSRPGQKVPQSAPAGAAPIVYPAGLEACRDGSLLVADPGNSRIWRLGGKGIKCR